MEAHKEEQKDTNIWSLLTLGSHPSFCPTRLEEERWEDWNRRERKKLKVELTYNLHLQSSLRVF